MPPIIPVITRNRKNINDIIIATSLLIPILANKNTAPISLKPKPPIVSGSVDIARTIGTRMKKYIMGLLTPKLQAII